MTFANLVGNRIRSWFTANAEHITARFLADPAGMPLAAGEGYLRLWLAEGFLAKRTTWGNSHFPALHGGVTLTFAQQTTPFHKITEAAGLTAPGAYLDYPMTPLLPFSGGTVELTAGLYRASVAGPLSAAVTMASSIASLFGPPLSTAATIADKVSDGLDAVLAANDANPVLGVHWTLIAPGGGGQVMRPGHLVIVNAPERDVPGDLHVREGRLRSGNGLLTGLDYLVLRVECRTERDDWRFPELESMRQRAAQEFFDGNQARFERLRTDSVLRVLGSPDLTETDRLRVAKAVRDMFDAVTALGAVPTDEAHLDPIPTRWMPGPDEAAALTEASLLAS